MLISLHAILTTKFNHAEELALRNLGYTTGWVNFKTVDTDVNQQEKTAVNALLTALHAVKPRHLMDVMPLALDKAGHHVMLIDIYDLEVASFAAVEAVFNQHVKTLCDQQDLVFKTAAADDEFQLTIKQADA